MILDLIALIDFADYHYEHVIFERDFIRDLFDLAIEAGYTLDVPVGFIGEMYQYGK